MMSLMKIHRSHKGRAAVIHGVSQTPSHGVYFLGAFDKDIRVLKKEGLENTKIMVITNL